MQLKIIKKNDVIYLIKDSIQIEDYKISDTIDFSKLMSFLISNELSEKIEFEYNENEFVEAEKVLLSLLIEIKDNYNQKVDEFNTFKCSKIDS